MGALRQKGLDETQVEQCRQLMRSIPRYLTSADREQSGLPQVTWTDVEKLLLNAVQSRPGSGNHLSCGSADVRCL